MNTFDQFRNNHARAFEKPFEEVAIGGSSSPKHAVNLDKGAVDCTECNNTLC